MSSEDQCLSSTHKKKLIQALIATFQWTPVRVDEGDLDLSPKEQQELFDFAYTLVIQMGVAGYVPLYNSLYALYRGMIPAARWAVTLSAIFLSLYLIDILYLGRSDLNLLSVLFAVFLPLFSWLGWGKPLKNRFDDFAKRFAVSVYRNFWSWYITSSASS